MTKLVIFDLDGTLCNSIADLGHACNHALQAFQFPVHAMDEYPRMVGNGINRLIERALPVKEQSLPEDERAALVQQLRTCFIAYYDAHCCDFTQPYEGIQEVLAACKQNHILMAVATNKYQAAAERIVRHFFPNRFNLIHGEQEGVPRKPDPESVRRIMAALHAEPEQTVFVGDSLVDIQTAGNAGLSVIACSWGFCPRQKLENAQPNYLIDDPLALVPLLIG